MTRASISDYEMVADYVPETGETKRQTYHSTRSEGWVI
jgi:hypothetical protein